MITAFSVVAARDQGRVVVRVECAGVQAGVGVGGGLYSRWPARLFCGSEPGISRGCDVVEVCRSVQIALW